VDPQRVSVTETASGAEPRHEVVIVGAGAGGVCAATNLLRAGVTDFTILEKDDDVTCPPKLREHLRLGRPVMSSVFDGGTDTWTLHTRGGEIYRGRVVLAAYRSLLVPWIPNIAGQNDFRGVSFHSAARDRDFDPTDKRIAVVGVDATAARCIDRLTALAGSVEVFAYPPRRLIPVLRGPAARATHWLRHAWPLHAKLQSQPRVVRAPIDTVTGSGVRTRDGIDHHVDAIVYGTGFCIADHVSDDSVIGTRNITIRKAWRDGMEPYWGLAVHGFPNYFLVTGPDYQAQARYIISCLRLMARRGSTRIEVRRSSQQVFNERVHLSCPRPHPVASAFDLSANTGVDDQPYDGPATLGIADTHRQVRVRLTGYLDPIDGQYHWQGTLFDTLPTDLLTQTRTVTLTVGERSAPARIIEETPQHTHTIAGVGTPPFALDHVELTVPHP
jgi:cation diffusion facilitator CzcD-associated flavoprotein CzcO